jgi:hypothetical protein
VSDAIKVEFNFKSIGALKITFCTKVYRPDFKSLLFDLSPTPPPGGRGSAI